MSEQRTLWDYAEEPPTRHEVLPPPPPPPVVPPPQDQREARDQARRKAIRKLRASGHWLTLLRVARTISQPFTLNDISVAVWHACPEFFGMKGYPYPDNHKVHYILYGDRGLIAKGLIRRVQQGLFRIPDELDLDALHQETTADPDAETEA